MKETGKTPQSAPDPLGPRPLKPILEPLLGSSAIKPEVSCTSVSERA